MKNNDDPFYIISGKKYDRVTSVLKIVNDPQYDYFKKRYNEAQRLDMMSDAAEIGKKFHEITNQIEKGIINYMDHPIARMLYRDDIQLYSMVNIYFKWFKATVDKVLAIEKRVSNKVMRYAGTIDLIVTLQGSKEKILIEKKTSKIKSKTYELQKIAYLNTDYCRKNNITKCLTVIIDRDGKLHRPFYTEAEYHFKMFVNALELYRYMNKIQ